MTQTTSEAALVPRRWVARGLGGFFLFVVLIPLVVIMAVVSWFAAAGRSQAQPPAAIGPATGIPPAYIPLYNEASRVFSVNSFLLAAIHKQETGFSSHPDTFRINFAGCCIGPMQMNVTDGTWETVKDAYRRGERPAGYPFPAAPHPQPTDSFDAIMAAADLLRRKVGGKPVERLDETAWTAARNYAGAGPEADRYADAVLAIARAFEAQDAQGGGRGGAKLGWPVPRSAPLTSPFCERRAWEACHPGVDLAVPTGSAVVAAAAGRLTIAGRVSGYGNYLCMQHRARLSSCYAHLSRLARGVHLGAFVDSGDLVGYAGCTGLCFGPHLHFEVRLGPGLPSPPVDPLEYLPR